MKRLFIVFVILATILSACTSADPASNETAKQTSATVSTSSMTEPTVTETTPIENTSISVGNLPLTITCKPSGEYSIEEYNGIQYWQIVYFEDYIYSHTDVYILFATKDEAAYYSKIFEEELCDNGYIVKLTSNNGSWRGNTREEVIENSDKYRNSTDIKIEDDAINPCDRFDEIKKEYNLH